MGRINATTHSFNTGEVSVDALARVDQEKLRLAAEVQENIFPHVIGKGMMRPATEYIGTTKSNNQARLIKFVKEVDDTALLEMSNELLRVWVNDELVTRASVTSTVTNGDFSSSTGWTLTTTGNATANINSTVGGSLYMACPNRGGTALCKRSVSTSSAGTEHALKIVVTRGPVEFRCGSTDGGDEYIEETELDTGTHSLAFTPTGTYYVQLQTRRQTAVIVDSIEVEAAGVLELAAPWTTAQLREIRYDQSGDIIFLAHTAWQQRKIERRGTTSWSLVLYRADDGPFTLTRTSKVRLKPGATRGNTTLTADAPFFKEDHVGCLFRLTHDQFRATFGLGGDGVYTDPWRVNGIKEIRDTPRFNDRAFSYSTTGTWSGTITMQRSLDGPEAGFRDYEYNNDLGDNDFTTNVSIDHKDDSDNNNLEAWHRLGFKPGHYNSGSITISVRYDGHSGSGVCRVTAYNSATSVDVEVLDDFKSTDYTDQWLEGEWSERRGWPSAVAFFDGRLWWARKDQFWGSESDNYYAYNLETEGDSGSIQRNIATGGSVNHVQWMVALQRLLFGTTGAEASARANTFDEPLTPTAVSVKDASTQGCAPVSPAKIDGRGIFVQRSGRRVLHILYSFEANDYISKDLTSLNEDIAGDGIVELDVQRQPESYVWCIREDGEVALLLYDISESVTGWSRFVTDGEVESVCVLPGEDQDLVYLSVKRTINLATVRYIEKLAKHSEAIGGSTTKLGDAGILTTGPTSTVTAAHLANATGLVGFGTTAGGVKTVLTGLEADGGGEIALGAAYSNVWVGLPYTGRYKSAKLAYGSQGGTALLQPKIVRTLGLIATNVHANALKFGPDFDKLTPYTLRSETGQTLAGNDKFKTVHEEELQAIGGEWSTDHRVCLTITAGYPASLNAIVMAVETNER